MYTSESKFETRMAKNNHGKGLARICLALLHEEDVLLAIAWRELSSSFGGGNSNEQ